MAIWKRHKVEIDTRHQHQEAACVRGSRCGRSLFPQCTMHRSALECNAMQFIATLIHSDLHCSELVPDHCTAPMCCTKKQCRCWIGDGWETRHSDTPVSPAATVHLLKRPRFTPQHCFPFSHPQMFPFPTLSLLFFDQF